jgi:hypothetical protein
MYYANQCLALSEHPGYKKGMSNAYSGMGQVGDLKGDYLPALEFHKKSLKLCEEIEERLICSCRASKMNKQIAKSRFLKEVDN